MMTDSTTFDFIFFVQKDENNYENCILHNRKCLLNFMNRSVIDVMGVDIHFHEPIIVDNEMDPVDLKQHISDSFDKIAITTAEIIQEREILAWKK